MINPQLENFLYLHGPIRQEDTTESVDDLYIYVCDEVFKYECEDDLDEDVMEIQKNHIVKNNLI